MISKLERIEARYKDLNKLLADPIVIKDYNKFRKLSVENSRLEKGVALLQEYRVEDRRLVDAKEMLNEDDKEMLELAQDELAEAEKNIVLLNDKIKMFLIPPDPNSGKGIIVEIRAGTGGDESALFVANMLRMYTRFAEMNKLCIDIVSSNETGLGGFKEIIFSVEGDLAYDLFRFEMGTHRVQRVPETESSGRIHTSAVTVAVLPEAEDSEIEINENDLRIDVFRSSGPGGQSVNTTDSAVRITHNPSGLVVTCQDEKSQHKNKAKAMKVLRARLYEKIELERHQEMSDARKSQIGSGDRSGRIRTYNFQENRVTDHRIKLTIHNLAGVLEGELGEVISALDKARREDLLDKMSKDNG